MAWQPPGWHADWQPSGWQPDEVIADNGVRIAGAVAAMTDVYSMRASLADVYSMSAAMAVAE